MSKTESGYQQQITIWVPCHPNDPASMRHADALSRLRTLELIHGGRGELRASDNLF